MVEAPVREFEICFPLLERQRLIIISTVFDDGSPLVNLRVV